MIDIDYHHLEKKILFYADNQPDPLEKWYPSEEEPITSRQKKYLENPLNISARKAEMLIEDCAIKEAIFKYWINSRLPIVEDSRKEGHVIKIYDLSGSY